VLAMTMLGYTMGSVLPLLDTRPDILAVDEVDHVCNVWALKAELADSPH
jgi:hypothetical protein